MTESNTVLIRQERDKMVQVAQEILSLLENSKKDHLLIKQKLLQFSAHLANIGGYCDKNSQQQIHAITEYLSHTIMLDEPLIDSWYRLLGGVLENAIGVQVDSNKKPFKVVGLDIKALGVQLKALLKRK